MARAAKRKHVTPAASSGKPTKRQRKPTQPFEQGVNPAPLTPPSTVRPLPRTRIVTAHSDVEIRGRGAASSRPAEGSPSPLFEPEQSQLAIQAQADNILGFAEDEDEVEEQPDPLPEEEEVTWEGAVSGGEGDHEPAGGGEAAAGDSSVAAAALSTAPSTQPARQLEDLEEEEVDETPHLHFRWRACWGAMEKNAIASACKALRNKPLYVTNKEKVWRWAEEVVVSQKPRVAKIESLTATLYYSTSRQAKGDRCTLALQRTRFAAGEGYQRGNWQDLVRLVEEMDKENPAPLNCDFDLVLKEEQLAVLPQASQLAHSIVRARPGIVTAIQEAGLAGVYTAERFATGAAIAIKDRWRCQEERCDNYPMTCWVRRPPGREIDRFEDHHKLNGNLIAAWASAVQREECTVNEPSDDVRLSIMMAKERAEAEKRRKRRKVSLTSLNSSIEGLTKAILAGHLAQMSASRCQHQAPESYSHRRQWVEFDCSRAELFQHTQNFFQYWYHAMPQSKQSIKNIRNKVFTAGGYDINMLMDSRDGMTMKVWVDYFDQTLGMLSHLRRKAHDWMKDYAGLSVENITAANRFQNGQREFAETPEPSERGVLEEISGNSCQNTAPD